LNTKRLLEESKRQIELLRRQAQQNKGQTIDIGSVSVVRSESALAPLTSRSRAAGDAVIATAQEARSWSPTSPNQRPRATGSSPHLGKARPTSPAGRKPTPGAKRAPAANRRRQKAPEESRGMGSGTTAATRAASPGSGPESHFTHQRSSEASIRRRQKVSEDSRGMGSASTAATRTGSPGSGQDSCSTQYRGFEDVPISRSGSCSVHAGVSGDGSTGTASLASASTLGGGVGSAGNMDFGCSLKLAAGARGAPSSAVSFTFRVEQCPHRSPAQQNDEEQRNDQQQQQQHDSQQSSQRILLSMCDSESSSPSTVTQAHKIADLLSNLNLRPDGNGGVSGVTPTGDSVSAEEITSKFQSLLADQQRHQRHLEEVEAKLSKLEQVNDDLARENYKLRSQAAGKPWSGVPAPRQDGASVEDMHHSPELGANTRNWWNVARSPTADAPVFFRGSTGVPKGPLLCTAGSAGNVTHTRAESPGLRSSWTHLVATSAATPPVTPRQPAQTHPNANVTLPCGAAMPMRMPVERDPRDGVGATSPRRVTPATPATPAPGGYHCPLAASFVAHAASGTSTTSTPVKMLVGAGVPSVGPVLSAGTLHKLEMQ